MEGLKKMSLEELEDTFINKCKLIYKRGVVVGVEIDNNQMNNMELLDLLDMYNKNGGFIDYEKKGTKLISLNVLYERLCSETSVKPYFKYKKTDENAVSPYKERASDSGYDLTLIKKVKTNGKIEFYDTGISVQPSYGYYFDLVGRSSISKSGYMLANNVGIIDRSYRGSIIVPLVKIDDTKPDLQLPIRLVQIIPRQIQHLQCIEVSELDTTERGEGGFGSSG